MIRSLGPIDLRNVWRDNMMPFMLGMPVLSAFLIRWGIPPLTQRLLDRYGFDLSPYYPSILSFFFVIMCPIMFSFLTAFLLLDEKDDRTLTALQVTPLPLHSYLLYRVFIPILLTIVLMFVIFPIGNLVVLSSGKLLVTALAAAPIAPLIGILIASQAQNKVQGFAFMKVTGQLLLVPVLANFVSPGWELAFGIFPTYWPMKVYLMLQAGEPGVWPYFVIALAYQSALILLSIRRFNRVLHR